VSPTYAANTSVSVESSRGEIERTLQRYGATSFAYGWDQSRALIEFAAHERRVRFVLTLPDRNAPQFTRTPSRGHARSEVQALAEWEKACRQRWRALALVVKAKLEAVEAGISEFEDEFLAHIVLPDGSTAGQWLRPQIADAYATGSMPAMLPALGRGGT
jgi:hypothetical protein